MYDYLLSAGLGQVIIKDLTKRRANSPPLDPRSSSRTPAANREPAYKTRYESPIFACECIIYKRLYDLKHYKNCRIIMGAYLIVPHGSLWTDQSLHYVSSVDLPPEFILQDFLLQHPHGT